MSSSLWVLMVAVFIGAQQCVVGADKTKSDNIRSLFNHVLDNYPNRAQYVLPAVPTKVEFGMTLISITQLNHAQQTVSLSAWLRMKWIDARLAWDPADYSDIEMLRIPTQYIWKPDIVLYDSIDGDPLLDQEILTLVHNDGTVIWIPPVSIKVACPGEEKNKWKCELSFGSWTYDSYSLDMNFFNGLDEIFMETYAANRFIDIKAKNATKHQRYYDCCKDPYTKLTFGLEFESGGLLSGSNALLHQISSTKQVLAFIFIALSSSLVSHG